jgi:hypothetical protein
MGRLFRAIHAEAAKRGMDHDALRDLCREHFGVHSMGQVTESQLAGLYKSWTGHQFRSGTKAPPLPKRGYARGTDTTLVSGGDIERLGRAFARLGWGEATQRAFVERQLRGRHEIRTRRDFWIVFSGLRAMQRRRPMVDGQTDSRHDEAGHGNEDQARGDAAAT